MDEIDNLKRRVSNLELINRELDKLRTTDLRNEYLDDAKVQALYSIVLEMAEKMGVSNENFLKHFQTRQDYWHSYALQQAEKVAPSRAAEIDVRPPDRVSTDEPYPSLFDPPVG